MVTQFGQPLRDEPKYDNGENTNYTQAVEEYVVIGQYFISTGQHDINDSENDLVAV
jgi:hypothetical protein